MLKTTVFVQKVNNLSDARYCAGMGVQMMSFDFSKIDIETAKEISNWIEGVEIVVNSSEKSLDLEYSYILVDNEIHDMNGELAYTISNNPSNSNTLLIADTLSASEIEDHLSNIGGIVLTGGNEIRPGYKDFDELADVLEALEIE